MQGVRRQKKRKSGATTSSSEGIGFFPGLESNLVATVQKLNLGQTWEVESPESYSRS